jgi:hypothetical protein
MSTDDLSAIHRRLDSQDATLSAIHGALVGNGSLGNKGLVTRLERAEESIKEHDAKMIRWGGIIAGASVALSLVKDRFLGGH